MARGRDLELEAGARAHFEDPLYYSETYDWRDEDAVYYRSVATARGAESILEHGVGNGRVALPFARAGIEVTGIDHCQPMLDHLRERLKKESPAVRRRVKLHQGDIRTMRLGGGQQQQRPRFPLIICPFNAVLHLYTREDIEQWLDRVREHMAPGGELVFDISMPVPADLARDPNVPYRIPAFEHPTVGRVSYREHFDYDRVRQILFVSMFFEPAPKPSKVTAPAKKTTKTTKTKTKQLDEEFMTPLAHRQFYPCEMEALLHYNGWDVTELYGDFKRGPLVQKSDVMVWHAKTKTKTTKAKKTRR